MPAPQLQRRYSVTGQTPPGHVGQPTKPQQHSPKLQALDTSMQSTPSCGLCDGGADAAKASPPYEEGVHALPGDRGRTITHQKIARMSSKRSATQLPSPSTPTTHELPPKIAKLGLTQPAMELDTDEDEGVFTGLYENEAPRCPDLGAFAFAPSCPSTASTESLPDEAIIIEPFDLDPQYDSGVESRALTPLPSPSHTPPPANPHTPITLLSLPPELRHQIYLSLHDLVLPYPLIYCLSTFNNNMQHPLASVSRLVRAEALAIFYSYNSWIIKLEFKMMYEAFQDWIIRLGEGAGLLRLVTIAVRGKLFKPRTSHNSSGVGGNGHGIGVGIGQVAMVPGMPAYALVVEEYCPPDGDASFSIDLSEKYPGGRVRLVRNDGTAEAGERATEYLRGKVAGLWERRRKGVLNGQDWVDFVDDFLGFAGWW